MKLIFILAATSKIVTYGAQKTRTHKLKSRFTQTESLFGADFWCSQAVIVNGDRYRSMLNELLFTKIEEEDIGNIWFQQDGATCHTAEVTLEVLRPVFKEHIISHKVDVVWPPLSCEVSSKISVTPTSQRQLTL